MIVSVTSRRALPRGTPVVAGVEVQRLAEPHGHLRQARHRRTERLDVLGAGQPDRDDGRARGQREVRHAGAASVEPPVARAGALGVDPERLALAEHVEGDVEGGDRGLGVVAVDGHHADPLEPAAGEGALDAGAGEVVLLGQEHHLARRHDRDDQAVGEGEVVAGHDDRAGARDVLEPLDARAPDHLGHRWHDRVHDLVEHRCPSPRPGAAPGAAQPARWPSYGVVLPALRNGNAPGGRVRRGRAGVAGAGPGSGRHRRRGC